MAPRRRDFGELSPRLLELSAETNTPDPYEVTSKIVVPPPTKTRTTAMREAHMEIMLYQSLLGVALKQADSPPPEKPSDPGDDATDEQRDEWVQRLAEYERAHAEWQAKIDNLDAQVEEIKTKNEAAVDKYNRAFFGDAHDDVMEFFEDKPNLWDKFVADIKEQFLGIVNPPPDGTCPECGQVIDAEEAGKAQSSSISSTTTGTPSRETSPSTATASTPASGSADDDPGPSS